MSPETKWAILTSLLLVARANDRLEPKQIYRLYLEFTGETLTPRTLQFASNLYLERAYDARDPGPFLEVMDPEDRKIVVAAGLAIGFEQGIFSDFATRCIANAARAMRMSPDEIESAWALLEPTQSDDADEISSTASTAPTPFQSAHDGSEENATRANPMVR